MPSWRLPKQPEGRLVAIQLENIAGLDEKGMLWARYSSWRSMIDELDFMVGVVSSCDCEQEQLIIHQRSCIKQATDQSSIIIPFFMIRRARFYGKVS